MYVNALFSYFVSWIARTANCFGKVLPNKFCKYFKEIIYIYIYIYCIAKLTCAQQKKKKENANKSKNNSGVRNEKVYFFPKLILTGITKVC